MSKWEPSYLGVNYQYFRIRIKLFLPNGKEDLYRSLWFPDPYEAQNIGFCPECGRILDIRSGHKTKDYEWEGSFIPELWKTVCCKAETGFPYEATPVILIPSL